MPAVAAKPSNRKPASRTDITAVPVDKGVKKPRGIRTADPDSWLSQMLRMEVGDTLSRATVLDGESATWSDVKEAEMAQRKWMSSQIGRAKTAADSERLQLRQTVGHHRSYEGDIVVVATVTRTE